jgi:hypothetical protein
MRNLVAKFNFYQSQAEKDSAVYSGARCRHDVCWREYLLSGKLSEAKRFRLPLDEVVFSSLSNVDGIRRERRRRLARLRRMRDREVTVHIDEQDENIAGLSHDVLP